MAKLDYQLNPVLMEGTVTKTAADDVALNLRGRLGVIHAVPSLFLHQPRECRQFRFYFSYLQIVETPLDYDYGPLEKDREFTPVLAGGVLSEVNDTAIKADCLGGLATIAVPRRWVFTDVALKEGEYTEFYISPMAAVDEL